MRLERVGLSRDLLAPLRHGLDILRIAPESPDAGKIHDMMDRQLVHLIRLADDLLDVSRVSQGKIELRRQTIEGADAMRSALETSRPLIEAAGHKLGVDLANEPIWLDADYTRLAQVVSNLLDNASDTRPIAASSRFRSNVRATRLSSPSLTPALAFPRPRNPKSSSFSLRSTIARNGRPAVSASGWRW